MRCFTTILILLVLPLMGSGQELVQHPSNAFPQWRATPTSKQHTKRILMQLKEETIENAINLISQKFEVSIATSVTKLPQKKVNLAEKPYTIEEALEQILVDTMLEPVFLSNGNVVIRTKTNKQPFSRRINGKVLDAKTGEPMSGVNILVRNQAIGTLTDTNGEFYLNSMQASNEVNLLFSYIGYQTHTQVVHLAEMPQPVQLQVQLKEDVARLDEVVVTGTSIATIKRQLGNSISLLSDEDISHSGAMAIDAAIAGKIAGAQVIQNSGDPAAGMSIRLRGIGSINGKSDPLVIVDGVIVNNDSPELIELQGTAQNRLVDINPNDVERIEIIKGAAAAAIYGSRANNGVIQIFTKRGTHTKPLFTFESSIMLNYLRKQIPVNQMPLAWEKPADIKNTTTLPAQRYNYQSALFQPSWSNDQYLSISGGTEETRYYVSASYLHNNGILQNASFSRLGGRFRLDQKLNKWANISLGGNYTLSKSKDVPNSRGFGVLSGFVFADNSINPVADFTGVYPRTSTLANPLEVINRYQFSQKVNRFIGDVHVNLTPAKGLSVQYLFGYDTYQQSARGYIPPKNTSNFPTGYALNGNLQVAQLNSDLTVNYVHDVSAAFTSSSTIGVTGQYQHTESIRTEADRLSPVIQTTDAGSLISRYDRRTDMHIGGAFVQQNFAIRNKIFLTGATRMDASSVFGRKERFQFYPKASVAYLLSQENFMQGKAGQSINLLKIRAAWGQSGNLTAIGPYDRYTNYMPVPLNGQTGVIPDTRLGNETLRPERQIETEIGINVSLFRNRLGMEITGYTKRVKDLLLFRELSPSSGFESRVENIGNMTNQGIEILLQGSPIRREHFTWKTIATYSLNRNKVDGIAGERVIYGERGFGIASAQNGYPLGVFYGNTYARDDQGNLIPDVNGLPQRARDAGGALINSVIGDPNPDFLASLINELSYKGWHFRMQWEAVQGMDVFNFNRRMMDNGSFGGGSGAARELTGKLPKGYGSAQFNILEEFVEDGSFVKLREISLSYQLAIKKWKIERIRASIIGRNLLSIDDYQGWDPEINYAGQSNVVRGFDFTTVPIPATWLLNLSASF